MKNITILVAILMAVPSLEAQKQEIRKAQKAVSSGHLASASSYLGQARRIFAAADDKTRAYYYVVEAEMNLANPDLDKERLESISNSLKLANSYGPESSLLHRIAEIETKLKSLSAKVAKSEFSNKNFSDAATFYNMAYESTGDTLHFFNAARSHLLAKEYNEAFLIYRSLLNMGYNDAKTQYVATNIESGKKEAFISSAERDKAIEQDTHKKPEIVTSGRILPELLRGITIASIELNNNNAAIIMIDTELAKSTNDSALLNQAFHLYRQLDAKDKYFKIMELLIKETPNDPNLYYNFGVSSTQTNDLERAKKFYKKALDLNPQHANAALNLSTLLLEEETVIINEMNSYGASNPEDNRYEELKVKRNRLYYEILPYLESIVTSQPQNKDWALKLMNIYSHIGQDKKLALLQEKFDD